LPRSGQNLVEPGSDHIVPSFLQGWYNEQKWPRSFHMLNDPAKDPFVLHASRNAISIQPLE
jgi:hypothetical protein